MTKTVNHQPSIVNRQSCSQNSSTYPKSRDLSFKNMSDLEILKNIVNNIPELPNWKEQPLKEVALGEIYKSENKNSYAIQNEKIVGLNLQSNQLTTLPKEIAQLTNLNTLYLNSNQLTTLPKELAPIDELS
ncbi:MAG: hypothetical protein HC803_03180, partial [Saprospiraceae bacterium]|nr:hypothetical protein [Saprospiraceae bacterium]